MDLPLDDLLPSNDAFYEPPADLRDLFTAGSPLFELADVHKFERDGLTTPLDFVDGYTAGIFDAWLKSGVAFMMIVRPSNVLRLKDRAMQFNRTVTIREMPATLGTSMLLVSGHVRS